MSLIKGSNLKPRALAVIRQLNANQGQSVAVAGAYLYVYSATGSLAIDFGAGQIPVTSGDHFDFEGSQFDEFRIIDRSGATNDVTILVSTGPFGRKEVTSVISDIVAPNELDSVPDVSLLAGVTTVIAAADAGRREIIISNLRANTQTFRIGDVGAGVANGVELEPGDSITLETSAAVYGYNPGAGDESVAVAVTRNV